jgi:hypothetical protein
MAPPKGTPKAESMRARRASRAKRIMRAMKPVPASPCPYDEDMDAFEADMSTQATKAIATTLFNEYTDLIRSTFLDIWAYWCEDFADDAEERMRRNMRKAAASCKTELVAIITALEALAAITGSNMYAVPCEKEHWEEGNKKLRILVNVHSAHGQTSASTRPFVQLGNKLGDEDLVALAEEFFMNDSFMCDTLKNAVYKYHPDIATIANLHDSYNY